MSAKGMRVRWGFINGCSLAARRFCFSMLPLIKKDFDLLIICLTKMHERRVACRRCEESLRHDLVRPYPDKRTALAPTVAGLLAFVTPFHLKIDHSEECLNVKVRDNYKEWMSQSAGMHRQTCAWLLKPAGLESARKRYLFTSLQGRWWTNRAVNANQFCKLATAWCTTRKVTSNSETPSLSVRSDGKGFSSLCKLQQNCSLCQSNSLCARVPLFCSSQWRNCSVITPTYSSFTLSALPNTTAWYLSILYTA